MSDVSNILRNTCTHLTQQCQVMCVEVREKIHHFPKVNSNSTDCKTNNVKFSSGCFGWKLEKCFWLTLLT